MAEFIEVGIGLRDKLTPDLQKSLSAVRRFTGSATSAFKSFGAQIFSVRGLIGGLAAGLTVRALKGLVTGVADTADEVGKLSIRLGLSTEFLSEMAFVAESANVEISALNTGLQKTTKSLSEFQRTGGGKGARGFEILGLEGVAKNAKSLEDLLPKVADAFRGLENDTLAVEAAVSLFGDEGATFLQFLKDGSTGIEELRQKARELGLTLSREDTEAAAQFNDAITDLKRAGTGLLREVVLPLLPAFKGLVMQIGDFLSENRVPILAALNTSFGVLLTTINALGRSLEFASTAIQKVASAGRAVGGFLGPDPFRRGTPSLQDQIAADELRLEIEAGARRPNRLDTISQENARRARDAALDAFSRDEELFAAQIKAQRSRRAIGAPFRAADALIRSIESGAKSVVESVATATNALAVYAEHATLAEKATVRYSEAALGARVAIERLAGETSDFNQIAQLVTASADVFASSFSNSFVDFATGAKSAKEAFKDMANSIVRDLLRILTQQLALRAVSGLFSFIGGIGGDTTGGVRLGSADAGRITSGFTSSGVPNSAVGGQSIGIVGGRSFHGGGVVPGARGAPVPILAHAGEAVVETERSGAIPVLFRGFQGGSTGGGGGSVTNIFINAIDAKSFEDRLGIALDRNPGPAARAVAREYGRDPAIRARLGGGR